MNIDVHFADIFTTAIGPGIRHLLEDSSVVEIMANGDGTVWAEKAGRLEKTAIQLDAERVRQIIYLCANSCGCDAEEEQEFCAKFPVFGGRFQASLPPIVESPAFTLRKHLVSKLPLSKYVNDGIMTQAQARVIVKAMKDKKNILVAGGTGSGKTTLLNSILGVIEEDGQRIIVIEDTREIQIQGHVLFKMVSEKKGFEKLLRAAMRERPDRIVVGELRDGKAALTFVKALNTGHDGSISTIHASSASKALMRLGSLILEAAVSIPKHEIASAINLVIFIEREGNRRTLKDLIEVLKYSEGENGEKRGYCYRRL